MYYKFDTEDIQRAKAALILYAMYKSREKSSPLNGIDTWNRFSNFMRVATLRSKTTAEFIENFCRKSKIQSIRPNYLSTDDPVIIRETGELIMSDNVKDYHLDIIEDNSLLPILNTEQQYLIMLIRERIQREKLNGDIDNDEEN